MRIQNRQINLDQRLAYHESLVVFGNHKNRDAPVIYHRRDGPLQETGPPVADGAQEGTGPPRIRGNWQELILRKNKTNGKILILKWFSLSERKTNINLNMRKTKMKNLKLKRLLSLAFIGLLSALNASTVFAVAGDDIVNTATLNFLVGATPTSVDSNTVTFKEDRLLNFTVSTVDVASVAVAPSATAQITTFRVTNTGNGTQDFSLSTLNALTGVDDPFVVGGDTDSFDVTVTDIFVNSVQDAAGTYLAGTDTATYIDELAPGSFVDVFVLSTIPAVTLPLANGDLSVVSLIAQVATVGTGSGNQGTDIVADDSASADVATEQTVFGDIAGSAVGDAVTDGQHSSDSAYIVGAAILSVAKTSVALWDPVNGNTNPKMITGAYVQYTLVVTNDAAAGASGFLTTMTDTLATAGVGLGGLALDPDFVDGTAAAGALPAAIQATNTNGVGESFDIAHGGGSTRTDPVSCTSIDDAPDDGCLVAGQLITITFTTLMGAEDIAPVGAGAEDYAAGELKPGETVTIVFNAIVQ